MRRSRDTFQRHAQFAGDGQIHDRQRDRQPAAGFQNAVQITGIRIAVAAFFSAQPEFFRDVLNQKMQFGQIVPGHRHRTGERCDG